MRTPIPEGPGAFAVFIERAGGVVRAVPVLGSHLAAIPGLLDLSAQGGRGTSTFLLLLGLVALAAVAASFGSQSSDAAARLVTAHEGKALGLQAGDALFQVLALTMDIAGRAARLT